MVLLGSPHLLTLARQQVELGSGGCGDLAEAGLGPRHLRHRQLAHPEAAAPLGLNQTNHFTSYGGFLKNTQD